MSLNILTLLFTMRSSIFLPVLSLALGCSAAPHESHQSIARQASTGNASIPGITPNQAPAVPPNQDDCHFQYYTQAIDHFGQHNGTFQQKYNIITDYFKPGGPIFFYQCEEQIYLDCVDTSIAVSWAQQTNGIAVVLEHRYFGKSAPFGATDPTKQFEEYSYLTLDNVMADSVAFLDYLKKNVTGATDSKVIVFSGSYGGFLSTVYRQNHPEAIWGAIASAPPANAITNNSKAQDYYNWNIWLNNVYQDRSAEASSKIKNAVSVLEQRITSGTNLTSLKSELGLCDVPTKTDFPLIQVWIQNILNYAAEFNYATLRPGRGSAALPLELVVNITQTQIDPIQILNETLWMWFEPLGYYPCIDYKTNNALWPSVALIQQGVFQLVTCKYFPESSISDWPNGTIFGPAANPGAIYESSCDALLNVSTPTMAELQTKYKFTPEDLQNSTRIIWSLGQYDPTSGVSPNQPGINAPIMTTDRNVSRILYTSNMAHREDLFAPDPSDRDTVIQARAIELESIKGWLGWYDL
ncbi:hypothetical protein PV11_03161 [Exophiala sideris]|uniref:Serine aminopeptidase S33 domain-containing protein n=1 Tax=Exophiala sideris TaxID=1016849 RepID=A0A0D1Z188_9EURO|nr:hypothetical protein PV11_03161 [Exophiala sideris]